MSRDETPDTTGLREAGLQHRYNVEKVNDPTGKHAECRYFVLDPKHDPLARAAIRAYADAARQSPELVALADDLDNLLAAHPTPDASPDPERAHHQSGDECDPWCPPTFPHHTSDPAVVTPDAGDVEALTEALRTPHPDGYTSPLQSDYVRRLVAEAILASDWLANHVAAAREADRAEVADEFLLNEAKKYHDLWWSTRERLAGLVAQIAEVHRVLNAMGDPADPKHLHPQAASLILQIRDALTADAATALDAVREKSKAEALTEAADWIESTRSQRGIASAALDPGKAFAIAVLHERAARHAPEEA